MFNRRRLTLIAAAAACLFVVAGASANPLDTFTGASAPTYVKPSSSASFTVALTNDALSPDAAHRATVGIPAGFSLAPASVQATTSAVAGSCDASTWVADGELIADQKLHLMRPGGDITALCPGATLTVTFTGTSGAAEGSFAWTSELLNDASGAFTLAGSQPSVVVDGTNPTVTLSGKPSDPSNDASPSFTFSANENATFECKLEPGTFAPCTSPRNYPGLADGAHSFTVRATDAAGNFSEAGHSWTVDTVAPTVTLSGKPSNPSNDTSPTFTFSTGETATFVCQLDGAAFTSCSSPQTYPSVGNGSHTFTVRATDAVGNAGQASHTWTVDTVAPTASITDKPANPSNVKSPSFSFTAGEPSTFECKLDQNAVEPCSSPKNYTNLADGPHSFAVRAKDAAGNIGTSTYPWVIDTAAPTATIVAKPTNPDNDPTPTFGFTAGEPGAIFACKVDGEVFAACSAPKTVAALVDGAHTFTVRATDVAGNTGPEATYTWTVDTVAPTVAITTKPGNPSNDQSPDFTFSATEPSTFQCRLDAGAFAACTSPKSYANLLDAAHTFAVRATDQAGNASPPATYAWTIDTVAPTAAINSKPANPSNDKSPGFTFAASEPSTFACKLDGGAFAACTSPQSYAGQADGTHTFTVRATDPAGNTGPEASYAWTIDSVAPTAAITAKPSNPSNNKSPSFSFSTGEPSTFQCKLDAGAIGPCTSPQSYADLADGAHTFTVRATDQAGNSDTATYTWTVDTVKPTVTIGTAPSNPSNDKSPAFSFSANEPGGTFECRLDQNSFAACISAKNYANLADGAHTFHVRATDAAGNTSDEAIHTWTIDTIAPTTTINAKPSPLSNQSSATFTFTASEAGSSFSCKLDIGAYAACDSPKTYAVLSDGPHTFAVKAKDAAGNTGAETIYAWAIDTVAPTTSITGKPSNPSNDTSPSFSFVSNEIGSTFQCKLDAGSYAACVSGKTFSNVPQGSHTFTVKAADLAGNVGLETAYTWTIDTAAPTATITQTPSDPSNVTSPTFGFTGGDATEFQCKLDAAAFQACTSPKAYTGLTAGTHTFVVKAKDAAGNTSAEASFTWTIDLVAPTATITGKPSDPTNQTAATFTFTANEAGSSFECKLDGGTFSACVAGKGYTGLAGGSHTFRVKATDAAGNTGIEAMHTWTVDTVPPTVTISGKPTDPSKVTAPTFAFSANETGSTFDCRLDGAAFAPCSSPKGYTGLPDGSHTFEVKATDQAGNAGTASYTWKVDATGPTTTINDKPSNPTNESSASFTFTANEPGSTFTCKLDGQAAASCTSPRDLSNLADGIHTFAVNATDALGNVGAPATYTWRIDTDPPTAAITTKPADPTNVKSPAFGFTSNESGSTFTCRLEQGGFSPCTSPRSYADLADGQHDFAVRATDAAGNTGAAATYSWRIDTTAPTAEITSKPNNPSNVGSASFAFATNEAGASFVCSLDGGNFGLCTSPAAYGSLGEGQHTFAVKASDAAGNIGSEAAYAWTIETRAPTAAVIAGPSGLTNSSAATFSFAADEPSSFDCKVDAGGFEPCSSPSTYHGLGDGGHGFSVRARDAVGNFSAPASQSWTVDTTAPETTISSAPKSGTATSATFAFTASEGGTFECRIDGAPFAVCGSPKSYSPLRPGDHRFEVRAVDAAENADPTPALHVWKVDVVVAKVTSTALLSPTAGARVTKPPLLVWRRVARARYYNVQIFRRGVKVFSGWPTRARLQLKTRWKLQGKTRKLTPGTYRWYVWPGYGSPATRRYGALLGQSTFVVTKR